jgi:hypothetical protein
MDFLDDKLKTLASSLRPGSCLTVMSKASVRAEVTWLAMAWRLRKEGSLATLCHSLETQQDRATSLVGSFTRISRSMSVEILMVFLLPGAGRRDPIVFDPAMRSRGYIGKLYMDDYY